MEKLQEIFEFPNLFIRFYSTRQPLENFPSKLEDLIKVDIYEFITNPHLETITKSKYWYQDTQSQLQKISKIGTKNERFLTFELNPIQESLFFTVLKLFTLRNSLVATHLINGNKKISNSLFNTNEELKLYNNITLTIPTDIYSINENINSQNDKKKISILIIDTEKQRFVESLLLFTMEESKEDLKKLIFENSTINKIRFSCPSNSVIDFFKRCYEENIIVGVKSHISSFILQNFEFRKGNNKDFHPPSVDNIKNYLTRENPPSKVKTVIPILAKS